jgi:hypothetical protein
MAGYEDGDPLAPQQVAAARDSYVAGLDLHAHFTPPVESDGKDRAGTKLDGAADTQGGSLAQADSGEMPLMSVAVTAGSTYRGHAFISYVREDSGEVDALQRMLEVSGVPVWRDTASLWPGEDWRVRIRDAITRGALVFIACFSSRGAARLNSYQNEELLLAVDQLRLRRPDAPWLIPVRFDDCDVPDLELGAGRTLTSIQRADLFGAGRDLAAGRLVEAVQRLLQHSALSTADPPAQSPPSGGLPLVLRAVDKPGLSAEGAARGEFRELRVAHRRAAGQALRLPDMREGNASTGQVQCPICLCRFDWAEAGRSNYAWSVDQEQWVPLSRRAGESEQHWNHRRANAHIRCGSGSEMFEHYLPSLYGAYGEPIVITAIGETNRGKTTLLTMLGAELGRSPVLNGKLSFRPLDHALADIFRTRYARPLLEQRRPVQATADDSFYSFFHAWRGFNHWTGRPFILAFFDAAGGGFVQKDRLPSFISAANAFIFLASADAVLGGNIKDTATENIIDMLGPAHFGGLPTAIVVAKSDLLQGRPEVLNWLDRDDEADLSTIEQESEDVYAFLALNAAPGWLRPVRDLPSTTLHFLSATGTHIVDPDSLQFDERYFGPRRILRPFLSLLAEMGIIDLAQFTSHHGSR